MADMENQEDQKISECLQEAFGYSDEQLLKQLDHVNENFKDVSFAGAEERLMKRFMERKAEMERKATEAEPETTKSGAQAGEIPEITAGAEECTLVEENRPELLELEKKQDEKQNKKKIVGFGKKKALATAVLVAVIAGMLGGTAIGKRNYSFKKSGNVEKILLDNAENRAVGSQWEQVYDLAKKELDIPFLKFGYCPENLIFKSFDIYKDGLEIRFSYQNNIIYFVQRKKDVNSSAGSGSDRTILKNTSNQWINKDIEYSVNNLESGEQECEAMIIVDNNYYYIHGCIPETEFEEILKYLYFY